MFSALRKRIHPSPATIIASLALIFAMSGGAYAAKKYLITSTKQISPSVLKSLKGASGKVGPVGPAGPAGSGTAGPAGAVGAVGPAGAAGAAGEKGPQGELGKEGKPGKEGKEGSPWTTGGMLPKGATETGVWTTGEVPAGSGPVFLKAAISFPIQLAAPIEAGNIHVFEGTTIPTGCSGTIVDEGVTELKAASGNFCVWVRKGPVKASEVTSEDPEAVGTIGVGTHGGILSTSPPAKEEAEAQGTWAVTG